MRAAHIHTAKCTDEDDDDVDVAKEWKTQHLLRLKDFEQLQLNAAASLRSPARQKENGVRHNESIEILLCANLPRQAWKKKWK